MVLKFYKEHILHLLGQDPESAALFYRQLASALGNRLLTTCQLIE
jgi:hypothetical protein